jgi:hypothetical protein
MASTIADSASDRRPKRLGLRNILRKQNKLYV